MSRAPLRTAIWALISSIGLSIGLLAVTSFSVRTQLPPPASLAANAESSPEPSHDSSEPQSSAEPSTDQSAGPVEPQSEPVVLPDSPSLPVNTVSRPEESALAIGLEEALHPVSGDGEFIELPPPPEFAVAGENHLLPQPEIAVDELVGRLQTNFDELHSEFDKLHQQFVGLQGQFTDELTAVQSSQGDVRRALSHLVEATTSRNREPAPVEIDVTLLLLPLRGETRTGALALIAQSSSDFLLSRGSSIAERIPWATCTSDAGTLEDWLQIHGQARFQRRSTLRLEQQTVAELDLSPGTARGMVQARGAEIDERVITLPWQGTLAIRASATAGGLVNVELRMESTRGGVSENDWQRASLLPGGTLILTAVLDEEYRRLDSSSSRAPEGPRSRVTSRRAAVAETVALLQPRLATTSTGAAPLDVAAPLPFLNDESTTR